MVILVVLMLVVGYILFFVWRLNRAYTADLPVAWSFSYTAGHSLSTASDAEGTIYLCDGGPVFYALDEHGRELWHYRYDEPVTRITRIECDEGGSIYFISEHAQVVAMSRDGEFLSDFLPRPWEARDHPPIKGGPKASIVARSGKILYGLTVAGELAWVWLDQTAGYSIAGLHGHPVVADDGTIFIVSEQEEVVALNADGTEKWRSTQRGFLHSPAVARDGAVYVTLRQGSLVALDPGGGQSWSAAASWWASAHLGPDGAIYLDDSGSNRITAFDRGGGVLWTYAGGGGGYFIILGSSGGYLYCTEHTPTDVTNAAQALGLSRIYETDDTLHCISTSGQKEWVLAFPRQWRDARVWIESAVLLVFTEDSTLRAYDLEELGEFVREGCG